MLTFEIDQFVLGFTFSNAVTQVRLECVQIVQRGHLNKAGKAVGLYDKIRLQGNRCAIVMRKRNVQSSKVGSQFAHTHVHAPYQR